MKEKRTSDTGSMRRMFSSIAGSYDFLNHLFSLGIDVRWRRELSSAIPSDATEPILDLASGTGDAALSIAKELTDERLIVGADFTLPMLQIAVAKTRRNRTGRVRFAVADALALPFAKNTFSALSIAFGLRNIYSRRESLVEMARVLKPGGTLLILEFSRMYRPFLGPLFKFYFHRVIPVLGGIISGDRGAYRYLPASVQEFPDPVRLGHEMIDAGFMNVKYRPLTFGIAYLHMGEKPENQS